MLHPRSCVRHQTTPACQCAHPYKGVQHHIAGLKGRYAVCTSRGFIVRQIARFKLPLAPIRHDQRQEMHLYSNEQLARLRYPRFDTREMAMGHLGNSNPVNVGMR